MITGVVRTLTPVIYVADLDAAMTFYSHIGFEEALQGDDGTWAWKYIRCAELSMLLARGWDQLPGHAGPVQIYCQTDDVDELRQRLDKAGIAVEHLGYPEHAPGGEIRVLDPDEHVVMIAQTTGAARVETMQSPVTRTTILQRAAQAARHQGSSTGHDCHVGELGGVRCPNPADVKLADTWGDGVWSCLPHAEEVLLAVSGAFIADQEREGLSGFLARRRMPIPPP